ncbi:putative transcription factor Trihelix family [Lupinus albus]|uniref:Putative transcription factor Trihelix family n=1 Tax=Lupinus albus TaxID=3870 RepID=A0A6A4P4D8_LUPAL|nr:putative transcription factor Trihelix family [Lupinus albus]
MPEFPDSLTPPATNSRPFPVREDCWTEEASSTLVDAWGRRYLELNRGNLRQKDWQDVADAVNALHAHSKKTHRTDVQCKNRIDTIKKKYKIEKARVASSNGAVSSSWPFFERLDALIGPNFIAKKSTSSPSPSPPVALPLLPYRKTQSPVAAPFTAVALPQKRSASAVIDDGYFRRNYSAMAAAAAASEAYEDDEEEDDDGEEDEDEEIMEDEGRDSEVEEGGRDKGKEGMRRLAKAIEKFGEVFEKVEGQKLRQMVDLEKQRMQFAKDVEVQRMQMFMDTQVQLERIKRGKRSGSDGEICIASQMGNGSMMLLH